MFDFTTFPPRRHTNSYKWDIEENELSMGIADMDFETAPAIINAVKTKAGIHCFGYTSIPQVYYDSISHWFTKRHATIISPDAILYHQGVMPAMGVCLRELTRPGDAVMILPPVYHHFYSVIDTNGCKVCECPLIVESDGSFSFNRQAFEACVARPEVKVFILCNPHNPTGHIWSEEELQFMAQTCAKHRVFVISDEIHGDICDPGYAYTPWIKAAGDLAKQSLTLISPSKTFNIASLHTASLIATDPEWQRKMAFALRRDGVCEPTAFGIEAALAAYTEGQEWLEALRGVLAANKIHTMEVLLRQCPGLQIPYQPATFMLFVDCRSLGEKSDEFAQFLQEAVGLIVTDGALFGTGGRGFVRLNIAAPRDLLNEELKRFVTAWLAFMD